MFIPNNGPDYSIIFRGHWSWFNNWQSLFWVDLVGYGCMQTTYNLGWGKLWWPVSSAAPLVPRRAARGLTCFTLLKGVFTVLQGVKTLLQGVKTRQSACRATRHADWRVLTPSIRVPRDAARGLTCFHTFNFHTFTPSIRVPRDAARGLTCFHTFKPRAAPRGTRIHTL